MHLSNNLSEEQKKAASHFAGPALVLAIPGSGKTTVLLNRLNYLINQNINGKDILCLSFSKAAALEMKNRFLNISKTNSSIPTFATIHSFSLGIIKRHSNTPFTLIEDPKSPYFKVKILSSLYQKYYNRHPFEEELEDLISSLSLFKGSLSKCDKSNKKFYDNIFSDYELFKTQNNLLDFDDLAHKAFLILRNNASLLEMYSNKFKYILVDEAQDNSQVQYEFISLLSKKHKNIYLVADDDQSIYGFRGASPELLFKFKDDFKPVKIYTLSQNYRSKTPIIKASAKIISENSKRFDKPFSIPNRTGPPISFIETTYFKDELHFISSKICDGSNAILCRNNANLIGIASYLKQKNIPFHVRTGINGSVKHFLFRDIASFLNYAYNFESAADFKKIAFKINAYLSKKQLDECLLSNDSPIEALENSTSLNHYQKNRISSLRVNFEKLKCLKGSLIIDHILDNLGYRAYLEYYCKRQNINILNLFLIIENLRALANYCSTPPIFLAHLKNPKILFENCNDKKVLLSTIHGVKGLEFDNVFIMDCIDGQYPSYKTLEKLDLSTIEEERRLFYVGITRAKTSLMFLKPSKLIGESTIRSSFLTNILKQHREEAFSIGQTITHKKFGQGLIKSINGDVITAEFNSGIKAMSLSILFDNNLITKK